MIDSARADVLLVNGRIYTVDKAQPWVSAIAIKAGRIVAVGSDADVRAYAGDVAKVIDLQGKMAMPGIIDIHTHIMMGGQAELFELRFPNKISLDGICDRVRDAASKAKPGEWIIGGPWGADQLTELNNSVALAKLDAASLGHPVLLRDETLHNRWVNSEAMRICGITNNSEAPVNGEFPRDPGTGHLTGMMIEAASGIVEREAVASFTEEMGRASARQGISTLNSYGVTAFLDAATMQPALAALKGLDDRGELTAWAAASMPCVEPAFMFGMAGEELFDIAENYRSRHVFPDFVKVFLDGVPGAKTAAFHEPYVEDPIHGCCFRGSTMLTVPELIQWVGICEERGLAVKIHCAGDAAVSQALDAIEVVQTFNGGPSGLRHHIAHASYIHPDDIKRFGELDVAADLSPMMWYPTNFLEGHKEAMGEARAVRFWPNRALHEAGALLAGGSDWPVIENPDPWNGIEGMITRENPSGAYKGTALWPDQKISLETAIEIFTINSAHVLGLENEIGSIEVGKSADIIVLSQNLFEIPAHDIADTKVLTTYFEGRPIFERG